MLANSTIILNGAGAAIPWGASSTQDITKILREDTTFRSITGQPLGGWLYNKLIGHYHLDPDSVNFETIINAIDYLITFYASKNRKSRARFKNLMPAFFEVKEDINDVICFDRIYDRDSNGFWHTLNDNLGLHSSWKGTDYFFESVYRCFTNLIIIQIEKYSEPKKINKRKSLNSHLKDFLDSISKPLRGYTTNYDRLLPVIYLNEIFEGFSKCEDKLSFDLNKVLNDDQCDVYYNLHGSAHFDQDFPENVKYEPNKFIRDFGYGSSNEIDQEGRELMNSNIITGFNKPSRILRNPYLQFYYRFFQDCLISEALYIIGYSFGDIHINQAIKTSSLVNKSLKIVFVTYSLLELENKNAKTRLGYDWIKYNSSQLRLLDESLIYNLATGIVQSENSDRIYIYRKGYKRFLEKKEWQMDLSKIEERFPLFN